MLALYCRAHHGTQGTLCTDCQELLEYALGRLDHCPFGAAKSTCAHCTVHCYRPKMRARVQEVMRFAGPRMLWHHPLLALGHLWDGWRSRRGRDQEPSS